MISVHGSIANKLNRIKYFLLFLILTGCSTSELYDRCGKPTLRAMKSNYSTECKIDDPDCYQNKYEADCVVKRF